MKKQKIVILAKPKDLKKMAQTMACCSTGPSAIKAEE